MILSVRRRMGVVWGRRLDVASRPPGPGAGLYFFYVLAAAI